METANGSFGIQPLTSLPMRSTPTKREHDLLRMIDEYTRVRGFPPTLQEMADTLGVSTTRATCLATECQRRGWLLHEEHRGRSWRVVEMPQAAK